jgi:hypothetical protein
MMHNEDLNIEREDQSEKTELEETEKLYLVFSELRSSEGIDGEAYSKLLVGVATKEIEVARMIVTDHFFSLEDAGLNPLHYPLELNDNEDEYSITVEVDNFVNFVKWYAVEIYPNTLLDEFEL